MKHPYLCDLCGCFLDPGEGRLCEECRERAEIRISHRKRMQEPVGVWDPDQYKINVEEAV